MASYGLQYEKRRTSASNATGKYSKQNENEKENFELEPAINLLTSSYEFHEDEKRKSSLSNESKLNLFLEIRSIMLKQMMQNQHQITSEGDSVVPGHKGNEGGEEGRGIKRGLPVENSIESSRPSEVIPNTNTKKIKVSGSMTSFIKVLSPSIPLPHYAPSSSSL